MFQDDQIRWLQELIGLGHPLPFEIISLLGDTWGVLLVVALAYWIYGPRPAFTTTLAIALAAPLWYGLATLFAVPRPSGPEIAVYGHLAAGSFPSGHVFHAGVAWGTLAALTSVPVWVAVLAAVATGVARVYLGVHYPIDVLASFALAPLFVWLFLRILPRVEDVVSARARAIALAAVPALALLALLAGVHPGRLRRAEIAGMILAGPLAILLSKRLPRPGPARRPRLVAAGLMGLLGLGLASRLLGPGRVWIGGAAAALAFLWILVVAPELAKRGEARLVQ